VPTFELCPRMYIITLLLFLFSLYSSSPSNFINYFFNVYTTFFFSNSKVERR